MHVRAEGGGKPITFVLTGGERPEAEALSALLDTGAVSTSAPGGRGCGPSASPAIGATAAILSVSISAGGASAP